MKATIYNIEGIKNGEIVIPDLFNEKIRRDLVMKLVEASKNMQPYSLYSMAGRRHSASGTISHKRNDWKGQYGKGISRIPRKKMWRRGAQFYWIGAEVSGTRGGRRPHGPKGVINQKKINKKEMKKALRCALAATINKNYISERYPRINVDNLKLPIVLDYNNEPIKTKQIFKLIKLFFNEFNFLKNKKIRAGKGKTRGRKYKENAGILLITGSEEKLKIIGIDVVNLRNLSILDLYPLGRIVIYTKKAIEELSNEH